MKIAYIYPEPLPDTKARAISVTQTANALSLYCDTTLLFEENSKQETLAVDSMLHTKSLSKKFLGFRSNKFFNKRLLSYIQKEKFDVCYVRHLKAAAFLIEHKLPHTKVIFECHEIFSSSNPNTENLERYVYEHADGLVFINHTLMKRINKQFSIAEIPQKVIDNGCSFDLPYIKKQFDQITSMVYVGNFYPWKGVDFLLESMPKIQNLELHLYGGGDRKEELIEKVEEMGITDKVHFHGYIPQNEIREVLKKAQVAVIPNTISLYNDFSTPIKLYEYMASSTVVITADMPTIREIVKDRENGFLFKTGDKESFVETVNYVRSLPPEKLQEIAHNAYETSKEFTWEKRAERIVAFAKEVMVK